MINNKKNWRTKFNTMRVIIMYDLPNTTKEENQFYTLFRKNIIKLGYTQIQQSIYVKVLQSKTLSNSHIEKLRKIIPPKGKIRAFILTEMQYESQIILSGEINENELINDDERYKLL